MIDILLFHIWVFGTFVIQNNVSDHLMVQSSGYWYECMSEFDCEHVKIITVTLRNYVFLIIALSTKLKYSLLFSEQYESYYTYWES